MGDEYKYEDFENSKLYQQMIHYGIPPHMREGLYLYIEHGIEPGSFLRCVLRNDLMGAAGAGDFTNQRLLFNYANFLYNCAPAVCKGSVERYEQWIKRGQERNHTRLRSGDEVEAGSS